MSILHARAEDIVFVNNNDFYEFLGYMCSTGRVTSVDAEVPTFLVVKFQSFYNGNCYPITINPSTPSGLPKKFGGQFRINFASKRNLPSYMHSYMKKGRTGSVVGRINKSKYVEKIVLNHAFVFGANPVYTNVKATVPASYISDFDRGYNIPL